MNKVGKYLQENSQFIYSILLIILIPIIIVANALWQIRSSNNNMADVLKNKAITISMLTSDALSDVVGDKAALNKKIAKIIEDNPDITEITILSPDANDFSVTASSNTQNIGLKLTAENYVSAWLEKKPVAKLLANTTSDPKINSWQITHVLQDSTQQSTGLLSLTMSMEKTDAQNQKNLNVSLIILAVTVFLVLLLLVNHLRFFEYTVLFKKLKEVDHMKDDFISIATHEMKTPMSAIKGYISMMFEGVAGTFDQKTKVHLEKIYVNIQRLDTLLSETLDVSRLEQDRMQFDMQPYDISEIVNQSILTLSDQATAKGLTLTETKPPNLPQVFIDPERLRQVIDNLISNAIKYTLKGGVEISYTTQNGKLLTQIKDTGIGMNAHDRNNLFTQFYRIKNEKTVDIPGTGLGLWIAREIVQRMNGDICVESTENVGSVFTIKLPFIKK